VTFQNHKMEKEILTPQQKEESLIRFYFNSSKNFYDAGLNRAYLDTCRRLFVKDKEYSKRRIIKNKTQLYLKEKLKQFIGLTLNSQDDFDKYHEELCSNLIKEWNELNVGFAQKWINMTLKYWLLLGNDRVPNINKNAEFFHIPIDSYVLTKMLEEDNPTPWTQIEDYNEYMGYQKKQRDKNTGNYPILDEFIFFSNYIP